MLVGFARVSTQGQDLALQLEALKQAGCQEVFHGKQSGVSKENEDKLEELVRFVRDGDTVIVTKLDRLGRSLKSVLEVIDRIHAKGARLKTLDGAIDTSNTSPMAQAFINLLGTFAQLERDMIVSRTTEGREAAKANGVKFGRKPVLSEEQQRYVLERLQAGASVNGLAVELGVTRQVIYRVKG